MGARVAVMGAGLIGRKHIEVAAEHDVLGAIIDPDPDTKSLAENHGCEWFSDLDSCLADHRPDGVIIATPNQLHVDHGLACIEHGIPILIEKPIADRPDAAARLVDAAQQATVPILVGHHRRHNPIIKRAKAVIDAGKLGSLVSVHAQFWLYKPDGYFDLAWRRSPGAGPVFINLIHDIDLLRHLCGEVVRVQAAESSRTRGHKVEDSAVILLSFESGALGTVTVSDTIPAPWSWELTAGENPAYPKTDGSCYRIGGTKGALSIPDMKFWNHPGEQSWWAPINHGIIDVEMADPFPLQFKHFLDVIENGTAPLVSGAEGLQTLRVVDAIKKAAATGSSQLIARP